MKYGIVDGRLVRLDINEKKNVSVETVKYTKGEIPQAECKDKQAILDDVFTQNYSRYENRRNCDLICLNLIDIEKFGTESTPVYIVLERNHIAFYTTSPDYIDSMLNKIMHESAQEITTDCLLYHFMNRLIFGDSVHLDEIDRKLKVIETNAFSGYPDKTFSKQILNIKKHLMWIQAYYANFIRLIEELNENSNGFLCESTIKNSKMLERKIDRLSAKTEALLSYASEIRNAYQAEACIQQNRTVKILTILCVIILPIILLTRWFGMNIHIYGGGNSYGYPILLALSAIIAVVLLIFFKKSKWF